MSSAVPATQLSSRRTSSSASAPSSSRRRRRAHAQLVSAQPSCSTEPRHMCSSSKRPWSTLSVSAPQPADLTQASCARSTKRFARPWPLTLRRAVPRSRARVRRRRRVCTCGLSSRDRRGCDPGPSPGSCAGTYRRSGRRRRPHLLGIWATRPTSWRGGHKMHVPDPFRPPTVAPSSGLRSSSFSTWAGMCRAATACTEALVSCLCPGSGWRTRSDSSRRAKTTYLAALPSRRRARPSYR